MALKATIFKAELQIADLDRHYYQTHNLTIARHPSETDERMMVRLLAFALQADEHLSFTKGLSSEDEPDIWLKNYSEEIELWIDLGQPDEKRLRKACGRARNVVLYNYGGNTSDMWWQVNSGKFSRFENLRIFNLSQEQTQQLAEFSQRSMRLNMTIQEGHVLLSDGERSLDLVLEQRL
ncbi:YaeQ family protein [Endozoicomonas euniceicola]|uniref:YaeQ family protein n=1 Tax=Endozoicomonas euniceicola TaxID=1234143 RepID=A0ABY6GTX6_9GAMM|nr:YaeQ family protein [Endozoicomonas euniceicola]UYM16022.1 YaeQ family protein [Endozoicomonas euniceicola]